MSQVSTASSPRWLQLIATLLSSAVGNAATILATAWLVRDLGGEAFGRVALLSSSAVALGTIASSGVGLYLIRLCASTSINGPDLNVRARAALIWGQGSAAALTLGLLAFGLLKTDRPVWELLAAALALHAFTADAAAKNRLIGHQRVLALAAATVGGALLSVAAQLAGALYAGPDGYLTGFALGTCAQFLCSWWTCRHQLPIAERISWRQACATLSSHEFRGFVLPATLSASLVPLTHWVANLIAVQKTQRYSDVAILAVAMQLFNVVIFTPTVLNKLVLPRTIQHYGSNSSESNRHHTYRQVGLVMLLTAPAPLLTWLLGTQIAHLYRFEVEAMSVVYCFALASVFACACIPISNYLVSQSRMGLGLLTNSAWTLCYLGIATYLPGGASAVGYGLMTAYACSLAFALFLLATSESRRA